MASPLGVPLGPIWIASPPEVHSALLSSGPGPGSLLAAAGAWHTLSAEYGATAVELSGLLGQVEAGAWQGPSAQRYMAAHVPYVAWLMQAGADAAAVAAEHEAAAAAYTAAVAAMPTLAELATNHVVHGVLMATNFFGVNTIPIALNEADYVRMWIQAATAMGLYQAVSGAALASAPRSIPAPTVLTPGAEAAAAADLAQTAALAQATEAGFLRNIVDTILKWLEDYVKSLPYGDEIWYFLTHPVEQIQQMVTDFLRNPVGALITWGPLLLALAYQAFTQPVGWGTWAVVLSSPLWLPPLLAVGLSMLALINVVNVDIPVLATADAAVPNVGPHSWPVAGLGSTVPGPAGTPAPGTVAGAPAGTAPASAAPASAGFGYAVAAPGDWGPAVGPTVGGRSGMKAPAATIPAAAAAVPNRAAARAKRRRRTELRDYGDEFLDMNSGTALGPDPGAQASEQGAGVLGFAGTTHKEAALQAAGLTALSGDDYGGGPRMPLVPGTWDRDPEAGSAEGGDHGS